MIKLQRYAKLVVFIATAGNILKEKTPNRIPKIEFSQFKKADRPTMSILFRSSV